MFRNKIDADAHVDETDATWEYMTAEERRFKPISVDPGEPAVVGDTRPHRFWLVDGKTDLRRWRSDERTGTTREQRELLDVKSRLRHMDELGVEVQVIYPTYLLRMPTTNPEWQAAVCRSYNRWLADKTAETNGRLRWVVVNPPDNIEASIEELRFGKEHGAVGFFKRALEAGGKTVDNPYFYPLYEEAQRLDLSVCIHTGGAGAEAGVRPQIGCFSLLALKRIPQRFPSLRFGVIEAMASWVPYMLSDLRAKRLYSGILSTYAERPMTLQDDFLRENRFFVTTQTSDDVPYILKHGTEDSLMIGTDYSHDDQSGVIGALSFIEKLGEDEEISPEAARKILIENPRVFYGL